jgi:hypothetical protein
MKTAHVLSLINTFEKYPLEVLFAKALFDSGVQDEEFLTAALMSHTTQNSKRPPVSQPMRISIQNAYRDLYITKIIDHTKVPTFETLLK